MKRKTRFQEGGSTGRFEEDLYERARRFLREKESQEGMPLLSETGEASTNMRINPETGETYSTEAPAAAVRAKRTPPPVSDTYRMEGVGRGRPSTSNQIPVDPSLRGPEKRSSAAMDMGDTRRVLATTIGAMAPGAARAAAPVGRGLGALASSAREGWREGEVIKEAARAAERGAKSRAEIQAKRAARKRAEAEAMESAKPVLQARKSDKASRASRARRTEEDAGIEFSRGGSTASKRADGCVQRGKTRGRIY